jgi:CHAT domain-containing protein
LLNKNLHAGSHAINHFRQVVVFLTVMLASSWLILVTGCQEQRVSASNQTTINLYKSGDLQGAIQTARQTLSEIEKQFGPKHHNTATALENLASLLTAQDQINEARQLLSRAEKIRQSLNSSIDLARTQMDIAALEQKAGNPERASVAADKAYLLLTQQQNTDIADQLRILMLRADINHLQGQVKAAESDLKQAMHLFGSTSSESKKQLFELHTALLIQYASFDRTLGRLHDARDKLIKAYELQRKHLGDHHPLLATTLNNLGEVEVLSGRYDSARNHYLKALSLLDDKSDHNASEIAIILSNFAELEYIQGNFQEATRLISRSIQLQETIFGKDSYQLAPALSRLAGIYYSAGQYQKAHQLSKSIVQLYRQADVEPAQLINALANLGEVEYQSGRYQAALVHYHEAMTLGIQTYGQHSLPVASILANRAIVLRKQNRLNEAIEDYQAALGIIEATLGASNPQIIDLSYALAETLKEAGRNKEALNYYQQAAAVIQQRYQLSGPIDIRSKMTELRSNREVIEKYLTLLAQEHSTSSIANETYLLSQLARATTTAHATQQMAVRFASGSDQLASLIRSYEQGKQLLKTKEQEYFDLLSRSQSQHLNINRVKNNLKKSQQQLELIEAQLKTQYPKYFDLLHLSNLNVRQTQALLTEHESLLTYLVTQEHVFAWIIRPGAASFHSLPVSRKELVGKVQRLRQTIDPQLIDDFNSFDGDIAYQLYQSLFASLEKDLKGSSKIIVIPDRELYTFPLEVLISSPQKQIQAQNFSQADWLIKRYAFSYLPSVGALQAIRLYAGQSRARKPFLGIGDPVLTESYQPDPQRSASAAIIAKDISSMVALPETANELQLMASAYQATENDIILRENADELFIKQSLNLKDYQVIAFATHGLVAGELERLDEPGLVLTPPEIPSENNDGYLRASEIAQLDIDADWVILSACNTASSDGKPESDNLSGLVKAFFHAGSRSLLVSHWSVWSEATVKLTTQTINHLKQKPTLGRAEAHQKSALNMMQTLKYAHPMAWAPFVVIGDGS